MEANQWSALVEIPMPNDRGKGSVSASANSSELALYRKLLATLHLSVPEREALPKGRVRFSVLLRAAEELLKETGWLPQHLRPAEGFDGVLIEATPGGYRVHERREIGVGRFSPVQSRSVPGLADALRSFLSSIGGNAVDGVPIDYDA